MDRGTNTLADGNEAAGMNPHVFCLQGKTLAEALAECRTAKERLRLLPQYASLCDAIGAAHSRGVIHRGLNPDAVLLSDYGETVVSDWSLSKVRGRSGQQPEKFNEAAKTPALRPYLAPEIVTGGSDEVDARSDVYALGAILHQLLTGKIPQAGETASEPTEAYDPDVPRELVQICRRAMFQEASARYANASQLADSVRQLEAPPAPAAQQQPAAGVDPLYKTLLGAAVLCLIVLAGGFGFLYHSLSADRAEAVNVRDKEIEMRRGAEEARDKMAEELKEADTIRTRVESDRDRFEDSLATVRSELEQVRAELKAAKEELITAQGAAKRAETIARLTAPSQDSAPSEEPAPAAEEQVEEEGPVEPFSTPLPEMDVAPEEPVEAAAPEEPTPAPPVPKATGVEKADFAKAMPDLIASVVAVEGAESQAAIRVTDATTPAVKAMGFRAGDYVITRINRNAIKTVNDARRALANVQKDTGFSIRVTRPDGVTTWMRINFTPPPALPAPPSPQPEPAAQEPATAPANEAQPQEEEQPAAVESEPANE